MEYEWDDAKDAANQRKHGVPFSAVLRFDWNRVIHEPDTRREYGELRILSMAPIDGRLYVLVWTPRGERIRVISLRKANRREGESYDEKTRA